MFPGSTLVEAVDEFRVVTTVFLLGGFSKGTLYLPREKSHLQSLRPALRGVTLYCSKWVSHARPLASGYPIGHCHSRVRLHLGGFLYFRAIRGCLLPSGSVLPLITVALDFAELTTLDC